MGEDRGRGKDYTVDYVVLAIGGLGGGGLDICYVAAGAGLGDGDAGSLLPGEEVRQELFLQRFGAELEYGRDAKCDADGHGRAWSREAGAGHLVEIDAGVEVVPFVYRGAENVVDAESFEPCDGEGRG